MNESMREALEGFERGRQTEHELLNGFGDVVARYDADGMPVEPRMTVSTFAFSAAAA